MDNVYAKFGGDRLWNEKKALGDRKSDDNNANNENNVYSAWRPVFGSKKTLAVWYLDNSAYLRPMQCLTRLQRRLPSAGDNDRKTYLDDVVGVTSSCVWRHKHLFCISAFRYPAPNQLIRFINIVYLLPQRSVDFIVFIFTTFTVLVLSFLSFQLNCSSLFHTIISNVDSLSFHPSNYTFANFWTVCYRLVNGFISLKFILCSDLSSGRWCLSTSLFTTVVVETNRKKNSDNNNNNMEERSNITNLTNFQ